MISHQTAKNAFIIFLFSFLFISCKKDSQLNLPLEQLSLNKVDQIKKWLEAKKDPITPTRNSICKKILQNALFDKMYSEPLSKNEDFYIIPLKNEYFSKQINTRSAYTKNPPLQYLLVVQDKNGKIRRGDIVLFYPEDINLKALPQNSFHDFFNRESLSVDGTFSLVSLSDRKYYEMDFKNAKKSEFKLWEMRKKQNGRTTTEGCIDWYLVTTYYIDGVPISQTSDFVGTSCPCQGNTTDACIEPETNYDSMEQNYYGTTESKDVTLIVKEETVYPEHWKFYGKFELTGVKYQDCTNNYFTSIIEKPWPNPIFEFIGDGAAVGMDHTNLLYIQFQPARMQYDLLDPKLASARIDMEIIYPNQAGKTRQLGLAQTWQASILCH